MKFVPTTGRAVYGAVNINLNKFFIKDRAHYVASCIYCGKPHERKCDYVVASYVKGGIKHETICGRLMCPGCSTTFHTINSGNPIDFCPEHGKIALENIAKK